MLDINKFDKIIVANWKLNGSKDFIDAFFNDLNPEVINSNSCGIICPPSIYLDKCFSKNKNFFLGAQNCSQFNSGAYTGEINAIMLRECNCNFCIVGHSERRMNFNDSNNDVKVKSENLIDNSINPIICIGETLEQKKNGITKEVIFEQISSSLPETGSANSVIIAYEPIWAIGSGLTPNLEEINSIHSFIKKEIPKSRNYKILYGGSVKSKNSKNIMDLENVDGLLVGGASLDPQEFIEILKV